MANYGPTPSTAAAQPLYAEYNSEASTTKFIPDTGTDYGLGVGNGVPFGAVIVVGSLVGIAITNLTAGVQGDLFIKGKANFPKAASDGGMASGTLAYWDATNHVATATASANTYLGKVDGPGALTSDTVVRVIMDGVSNASGNVGIGQLPAATVAAAGSNQATAVSGNAVLSTGLNIITGGNATNGAALPTAPSAGTTVIVKNTSTSVANVWPDGSAAINAIAAHGPLPVAGLASCFIIASSATQWYTIPLLPS
jgi:predicted RecA/RadA family phage recombinase